jgi:hypothetical protein
LYVVYTNISFSEKFYHVFSSIYIFIMSSNNFHIFLSVANYVMVIFSELVILFVIDCVIFIVMVNIES